MYWSYDLFYEMNFETLPIIRTEVYSLFCFDFYKYFKNHCKSYSDLWTKVMQFGHDLILSFKTKVA